ncbi:MAG TPA: ABC transporter ATP-binding protein [Saprospiraceae bacterium]|nr:ABC transporter ATP-binding protein [Saprospiraceae bacterium]
MPVLHTYELTKRYGKLTALDGLSLQIEAGHVYGLLGPNGSGKTTTLGLILGILKKNDGTYEWFNGRYGEKARMKIGAILETPNFYPYLNAIENLKIVSTIKEASDTPYDELLELVELSDRKNSKFRTYSLGMKQRLAIAATLIGDPEVLIFDEPTNGLDPQGIVEVRDILKKIADSGKTVIMASHILDEVEKICSHVAIIKKGKLLAQGPVGAILTSDPVCEIAADDMEHLHRFLTKAPFVKQIVPVKHYYECILDKSTTIASVNKAAFEANIIITHLVGRKRRLEEEFLEITKNG